MSESNEGRYRDWDPVAIEATLDMELHPVADADGNITSKASEEVALQRLRENVAFAAEVFIDIMKNSSSEPNRMKAATEVFNRVFGKVTDDPTAMGTESSPLGRLLAGIVSEGGDSN